MGVTVWKVVDGQHVLEADSFYGNLPAPCTLPNLLN